jgi:hypothetical protein
LLHSWSLDLQNSLAWLDGRERGCRRNVLRSLRPLRVQCFVGPRLAEVRRCRAIQQFSDSGYVAPPPGFPETVLAGLLGAVALFSGGGVVCRKLGQPCLHGRDGPAGGDGVEQLIAAAIAHKPDFVAHCFVGAAALADLLGHRLTCGKKAERQPEQDDE